MNDDDDDVTPNNDGNNYPYGSVYDDYQQTQASSPPHNKQEHFDVPQYNNLQLFFLTTHYKNTKEYTDDFPLHNIPACINKYIYIHH